MSRYQDIVCHPGDRPHRGTAARPAGRRAPATGGRDPRGSSTRMMVTPSGRRAHLDLDDAAVRQRLGHQLGATADSRPPRSRSTSASMPVTRRLTDRMPASARLARSTVVRPCGRSKRTSSSSSRPGSPRPRRAAAGRGSRTAPRWRPGRGRRRRSPGGPAGRGSSATASSMSLTLMAGWNTPCDGRPPSDPPLLAAGLAGHRSDATALEYRILPRPGRRTARQPGGEP